MNVPEVPILVGPFFSGLIEPSVVWHCHDEQYSSSQQVWTFFSNCIQKHQQNFTIQLAFTLLSLRWKLVKGTPWESQNTVRLIFPLNSLSLHLLTQGEEGRFHCIEAHFDLGWYQWTQFIFFNSTVRHMFSFLCITTDMQQGQSHLVHFCIRKSLAWVIILLSLNAY